MLRVNEETCNVYAFESEGGHLTLEGIQETYGEIILRVNGKEVVEKRGLMFGQTSCSFVFTGEEINKIGSGTHPYSVITINEDGVRDTIIPDPSSGLRPAFIVSEA